MTAVLLDVSQAATSCRCWKNILHMMNVTPLTRCALSCPTPRHRWLTGLAGKGMSCENSGPKELDLAIDRWLPLSVGESSVDRYFEEKMLHNEWNAVSMEVGLVLRLTHVFGILLLSGFSCL